MFDVLSVVRFSTPKGYAITETELTYFCYLACLLSVYDGKPADQWGYSFAATKAISPYSPDLGNAIDVLVDGRRLEWRDEGIVATPEASDDLARYDGQSLFQGRSRYLKASCNSSLVIPLPAVGPALNQEPSLKGALSISATRELLIDESGPQGLHRHFERLAGELPDKRDLFVAAVTWISQLAEIATSDDQEHSTDAGREDVVGESDGKRRRDV